MKRVAGYVSFALGAFAAALAASGCGQEHGVSERANAGNFAPPARANAGPYSPGGSTVASGGRSHQFSATSRADSEPATEGVSVRLRESSMAAAKSSSSGIMPMAGRPGPFAPGGAATGAASALRGGAASTGTPPDFLSPKDSAKVSYPSRIGGMTPGLSRRSRAMTFSDGHEQLVVRPDQMNPNLYISNTYLGGTGARDRLEKLVQEGVVVDGKRVKLESFSRSYAQTFPIPTRTALHVSADTERSRIVQEGEHTYLQVGLQAIKGELPRRPPLNLALVIDRSGSMADGDKLEFAKTAALRLVDDLRPDDVFSLAVFDDDVQVLVTAGRALNKASIKRKIAAVTPGGGTNIYAGLESAYRQAARYASPEIVNRVILLSDGEVTSGVTDPREFQRLTSAEADREIQTTAVGLGLDFNEDLMMEIARDGKGNYHFIKDGADTRTVFAKELDELTHVVAKAVKLRIRLAEGVGLVRVLGAKALDAAEARQVKNDEKKIDRRAAEELGIAANRQTDRDEPGIKLLIPDFYRGDSHVVMLELAVPGGVGRRKVADVFLKYKDLVTRANQTEQSAVSIQYTPDRGEMVASINRAVKKNLLGFQTGEALADAGSLIARGQVASAAKRVDERMVVLGLAAREWGDRDLDRDGQLLARYETVIRQLGRTPQLAQSDLGQYVARSLTYTGYKMTR